MGTMSLALGPSKLILDPNYSNIKEPNMEVRDFGSIFIVVLMHCWDSNCKKHHPLPLNAEALGTIAHEPWLCVFYDDANSFITYEVSHTWYGTSNHAYLFNVQFMTHFL